MGSLLQRISKVLFWAARVSATRARKSRREDHIWFEGPFATWLDAENASTGYDAEDLYRKVLESTMKVIEGKAAFERDSVSFLSKETSWPLITSLNLASKNLRGEIRVLDFGGSLGSMFFQHRENLGEFGPIRWAVVEQAGMVELGNRHISVDGLNFYTSIEEAKVEAPGVIVLGSVLQYLPDYKTILDKLLDLRADVIFLDRNPVGLDLLNRGDTILVQHVPPRIYNASYPMRVFHDGEIEGHLLRDYKLALALSSASEATGLANHLRFKWMSQVWVRKPIF